MQRLFVFFLLIVLLVVAFPIAAQDSPSVEVANQISLDGTVHISSVYSDGPGFMVIHQDNGSGSFGAVIGHRPIADGWSFGVDVPIDASMATSTLYAMLHEDTGEAGVYEFGTVDGADAPVIIDSAPVSPAFNVDLIYAWDQFVDSTVTVSNVTAQVDGFMVIHADNDGTFGAVIGSAPVTAGQNSDVVVEVDQSGVTNVLWPMLHVDTGEAGVYEFGTVDGADGPVVVEGVVAVTSIWTVPHMRVADQIVTYGDGMESLAADMVPTVTAHSVLAEVNGFIVIHTEQDGGPGPVAGFAPVSAGINTDVAIELDPEVVTPRLWPMLHVDTGVEGEYEFGVVDGADGPVRVNDSVVTFGINAAPALQMSDQAISEASTIIIDAALIDAQGWIAIHSGADGSPGPVIATAPLIHGLNKNVVIEVDPTDAGSQVFPMLHYDTGEAGVYEFGTVDGADGPVAVAGNVVVGPLNISASASEDTGGDSSGDSSGACMVTPLGSAGVNLRASASTNAEIAGTLASGATANVNGQTQGGDGFIWWSLTTGSWVRSDIVAEDGACDNMTQMASETSDEAGTDVAEPAITGDEAGTDIAVPAATEEAGG